MTNKILNYTLYRLVCVLKNKEREDMLDTIRELARQLKLRELVRHLFC